MTVTNAPPRSPGGPPCGAAAAQGGLGRLGVSPRTPGEARPGWGRGLPVLAPPPLERHSLFRRVWDWNHLHRHSGLVLHVHVCGLCVCVYCVCVCVLCVCVLCVCICVLCEYCVCVCVYCVCVCVYCVCVYCVCVYLCTVWVLCVCTVCVCVYSASTVCVLCVCVCPQKSLQSRGWWKWRLLLKSKLRFIDIIFVCKLQMVQQAKHKLRWRTRGLMIEDLFSDIGLNKPP